MLKCTADLESFGTLEVVVSSIYSRYIQDTIIHNTDTHVHVLYGLYEFDRRYPFSPLKADRQYIALMKL